MKTMYVVIMEDTGLESEGMLTGTSTTIGGLFESKQEAIDCASSMNVEKIPDKDVWQESGIDEYYQEAYDRQIYIEEIEVGKNLFEKD